MFPQVSHENAAQEKRDPHHATTEKSIQSFRHQITHEEKSAFSSNYVHWGAQRAELLQPGWACTEWDNGWGRLCSSIQLLTPFVSKKLGRSHKRFLDPLAKPLLLPGPGWCPAVSHTSLHPGSSPRFAGHCLYFFSLRCHPTGLYQIFADGVSMPNHASQLLHYLGPKGHPTTHIHASKVRDKQKVLLCSCLPARVS